MPTVWDPWPGKTKENIVAINLEFFIMLFLYNYNSIRFQILK